MSKHKGNKIQLHLLQDDGSYKTIDSFESFAPNEPDEICIEGKSSDDYYKFIGVYKMNRVIKFRAWDGTRIIDEDYFFVRYGSAYKFMEFDEPQKTDYPLMQFTGLLDKNGIEIYEGDILANADGDPYCFVKWDVNYSVGLHCECLPHLDDFKVGEMPLDDADETIQVIGNIYENPELLENE